MTWNDPDLAYRLMMEAVTEHQAEAAQRRLRHMARRMARSDSQPK